MKYLTQEELDKKFEQHKIYIAAENKKEVIGKRLDLSNCDLGNLDIEDQYDSAKLIGTNFTGTKLKGFTFKNCDIQHAIFYKSYLEDVKFINCDLSGANFNGCMAYDIDFINCKLDLISANDANFSHINCEKNSLREANLYQVKIAYGNLKGITLNDCNLDECYMFGSDLSESKIINCSLVKSTMREVNLEKSNLRGSNLSKSVFRKTDIKDAKIDNVTITFTDQSIGITYPDISFDSKQIAYMLRHICNIGLDSLNTSDLAKKDIKSILNIVNKLAKRRIRSYK